MTEDLYNNEGVLDVPDRIHSDRTANADDPNGLEVERSECRNLDEVLLNIGSGFHNNAASFGMKRNSIPSVPTDLGGQMDGHFSFNDTTVGPQGSNASMIPRNAAPQVSLFDMTDDNVTIALNGNAQFVATVEHADIEPDLSFWLNLDFDPDNANDSNSVHEVDGDTEDYQNLRQDGQNEQPDLYNLGTPGFGTNHDWIASDDSIALGVQLNPVEYLPPSNIPYASVGNNTTDITAAMVVGGNSQIGSTLGQHDMVEQNLYPDVDPEKSNSIRDIISDLKSGEHRRFLDDSCGTAAGCTRIQYSSTNDLSATSGSFKRCVTQEPTQKLTFSDVTITSFNSQVSLPSHIIDQQKSTVHVGSVDKHVTYKEKRALAQKRRRRDTKLSKQLTNEEVDHHSKRLKLSVDRDSARCQMPRRLQMLINGADCDSDYFEGFSAEDNQKWTENVATVESLEACSSDKELIMKRNANAILKRLVIKKNNAIRKAQLAELKSFVNLG